MRILFDTKARNQEIGMQVYTNAIVQHLIPYQNRHEIWMLSGHSCLEEQNAYFAARGFCWPDDRILLRPSSLPYPHGLRAIQRYLSANQSLDVTRVQAHGFMENDILHEALLGVAPDLVHHHEYLTDCFLPLKAIQVSTVHDLDCYRIRDVIGGGYYDRTIPTIRNCMDFLITVSERSRADIIECLRWPEDRVRAIHLAPRAACYAPISQRDITAARASVDAPPRYVFSLSVVGFPHKNFPRLVRAFHAMVTEARDPDLGLIVTGPSLHNGCNHESIDYIEQHDLHDRVRFTGYAPDAIMLPLMAGAQAFCMPSLYEGFGLPAVEALALDLPLVLANNSSLPEVGGKAARYFNPYCDHDLAEALFDVVYREDVRERLAQARPAQVALFSWEKHARELIDTYESLV